MRRLLAICALMPWSASQAGGDGAAAVLDAVRALDLEGAEAALRDVPAGDPDRPVAAALIAYHRGRYADAKTTLGAAAAREPYAWLPSRIEAAAQATAGMLERREDGFLFRFRAGPDAVLAEYAAGPLARQRDAMAGLLGYRPQQDVVVEFFPTVADFVTASGLPRAWVETTGTVAIAKWDRVLVLSPRNMAHGYPWMDTLAHEYVHLALARASRDRAPVWFHEGTAKRLEAAWRAPGNPLRLDPWAESLLAEARENDALIPFEKMHPSMAALPSDEAASIAFAEVAIAVDLLLSLRGDQGFRRIVSALALHGDAMRAIDQELGPVPPFPERWAEHLAALPLDRSADARALDRRIADGALRTGDARDLDPVLERHDAAQSLVRVGDLLADRGHLRAAMVEYGRAAASSPAFSPALAQRQAKVLAAMDRFAEARDVLRDAVVREPEWEPSLAMLCSLEARLGDHDAAVARAREAIALNPFNPTPHAVLAAAAERSGDQVTARREKLVLDVLRDHAP